MKKLFFVAIGALGLCSFQELPPDTSIGTPVSFCNMGEGGLCTPRSDGSGFNCNPGGSDCSGTRIVILKFS